MSHGSLNMYKYLDIEASTISEYKCSFYLITNITYLASLYIVSQKTSKDTQKILSGKSKASLYPNPY